MKIACAPCCWGIEDPKNPFNPSYRKVLDEASKAGYKGIELGPYGYLPKDTKLLNEELLKRDLKVVAGTLYDNLYSKDNYKHLMNKTKEICEIISNLDKTESSEILGYKPPYLVVIDEVNGVRSPFAGHHKEAPRLDSETWSSMMHNIREVSKLAWQNYGVRPVIHPHAGGDIEYSDEILRFMNDIDNDTAGLCLDTGHLYYANMDPEKWLRENFERVDYIHFKDIDEIVYRKSIAEKIGFFEACAKRVMCPIGKGIIDYRKILDLLIEKNYKGYITIEQERDPRDCETSLKDITESLNYLKNIGY